MAAEDHTLIALSIPHPKKTTERRNHEVTGMSRFLSGLNGCRHGGFTVELDDGFDDDSLGRLLRVVAAC